MLRLYCSVISLFPLIARSQNSKFNYDRYQAGLVNYVTYYQPRSFSNAENYIYDKGAVSLKDFSVFYQWKNKRLFSLHAGIQTRFAQFKDSILFQTKDQFANLGMLIGKRLYITDHKTLLDINIGTGIRKLYNRKYLAENENATIFSSLSKDNSFGNSFTGSFLTDIKIHYEVIKSEATFFVGLSGSTDLYQFGNRKLNRFTPKYTTIALSIGFTGIF
jgi:hypothetical protein